MALLKAGWKLENKGIRLTKSIKSSRLTILFELQKSSVQYSQGCRSGLLSFKAIKAKSVLEGILLLCTQAKPTHHRLRTGNMAKILLSIFKCLPRFPQYNMM